MLVIDTKIKETPILANLYPGDCFVVAARKGLHFMRLFLESDCDYTSVCLDTGKLYTFIPSTEIEKVTIEAVVK